MKLTGWQLRIIRNSIKDRLEQSKKQLEFWKNYESSSLSDAEKDLIIIDIESYIKDCNKIIDEVSNAICKES